MWNARGPGQEGEGEDRAAGAKDGWSRGQLERSDSLISRRLLIAQSFLLIASLSALHFAGTSRLVPFVQPLLLRGRKEGEGVINVKLTKKIKKEPKRKTAFKIYVRPRPMTLSEKAANNYHVISNTSPTSVTLHVGRVHRSGNRLSTEHRRYEFDGVFNEDDGNEVVGETALGSVGGENKGEEGRTVICYGQTGTGKTYTFKAVLDAMKKKLAALEGGEGKAVYITFYEIHGKKCYDLMNGREGIKVLTDSNDKVVPLGAKVAEFKLREEGEGVEECIAR